MLFMQNRFQGSPDDFAMVVSVPIVHKKENGNTLDASIVDRVDKLSGPRVVECWERDPYDEPPCCEKSYSQMAVPSKPFDRGIGRIL